MENLGVLRHIILTSMLLLVMVEAAQSKEPVYDGKTLSVWLSELNIRPVGDESPAEKRQREEEAIRQIGTNGIPTLLNMLSITEQNKRKVLSKIESKNLNREFSGKNTELSALRNVAVEGFAVLGTNAEPAVPQLTKMLYKNDESLTEVIRALNRVGPKGFVVLTNAVSAPDPAIHNNVLWVLGKEGGFDSNAVTQILIKALKDPGYFNRGNAAQFLAGRYPSAIPALTELLDEDGYPRERAAIALASYGPAARSAAPKLLSVYTNSPNVFVLDALKAIDLEAAAKAESFILNGPLGIAGFGYAIVRLPNGKDLITGGTVQTTIPTTSSHVFSRAQLSDPVTGRRTETGSMQNARYAHVAVLLPNGKVLVAGGSNLVGLGNGGNLSSAELYDPTTGIWTETGSLNEPHLGGHAVLNSTGKVIYGGEVYDPITEKWTLIPKK